MIQRQRNGEQVYVTVPTRNAKPQNINALLRSLSRQDHHNYHVVLVGSYDDKTWPGIDQQYLEWGGLSLTEEWVNIERSEFSDNVVAVRMITGRRLTLVETAIIPRWVGRDTNIKRNVGANVARLLSRGRVQWYFFTDGKIQHQINWISLGIKLMRQYKVHALAGEMIATEESTNPFLSLFADKALFKRNPDFGEGFFLDAENFGDGESLPITACWAMDPEAMEAMGGFAEYANISYEDYISAWLACKNGVVFFCTNQWQVYHRHRAQLKAMMLEYARSGAGAGDMFRYHPECPFGKRRLIEALMVLGSSGVYILGLLSSLISHASTITLTLLILAGLIFTGGGLANWVKAKKWWGFFFPPLMALFFLVFAITFFWQFFLRNLAQRLLQTMWSWFTWTVR